MSEIHEWNYRWNPVSRKAWIAQIESDLKQKSVDTLTSSWWPGEPLNPVLHQEDQLQDVIRLPHHLFITPPQIQERIHTSEQPPSAIHSRIHQALQYGAQAILFQSNPQEEKIFNPDWMQDVHAEMITVHFQTDLNTTRNVTKFLQQIPSYALLRIVRPEDSSPLTSFSDILTLSSKTQLNQLRWVYDVTAEGNFILTVSEAINRLLADLSLLAEMGFDPNSSFKNCILMLRPDKDFIKQIIQTRVLQLLILNLKQLYSAEPHSEEGPFMETCIEQREENNFERFLIRASMSALAASLSGTHTLCMQPTFTGMETEFHSRIHRNIHHLLHLESTMYKGEDPMSGSYLIDYYTHRWTNAIWDRLEW